MVGFVVAMEKEARLFLERLKDIKEEEIAGKKLFVSSFLDKKIVLIVAGIGKVNTALATQLIIDKFAPNLIINFGVAGGKENSGLKAGDIVLLDKICQYDFDLSEIDNVSVGFMQDYNTIFYKTNWELYGGNSFKICSGATGDRFTKNIYFLEIIKRLGAQVVDMESGAIAQVCTANQIPFLSLKLISDVDNTNESIFQQYQANVRKICDKIPNAIEELMKYLKFIAK